MSEEYYEKNLFGEKVDVVLSDEESEAPMLAPEKNDFNIFALTDAIAARDKRGGWVIYQKALASGMNAEEIFWRVMWGVKALLLAEVCASAEESGLNPFVYRKAKSNLAHWKRGEIEQLSERLTSGFHDARRGIVEIGNLLERMILSL